MFGGCAGVMMQVSRCGSRLCCCPGVACCDAGGYAPGVVGLGIGLGSFGECHVVRVVEVALVARSEEVEE